MTKHFIICMIGMFLSFSLLAQDQLSSDFDNPTELGITNHCLYKSYTYDQTIGSDIELPECYRMHPGVSSWFSFLVPDDGKATVKLQFDEETFFGLAFYVVENGEYHEIKCDVFRNIEAELYLYPEEQYQNRELLVRFWKLGEADTGNVNICISGESGPSFPKALSVNISAYTPQQLVTDILITGCLTASNITYTGSTASIGYFSNGIPGLDFADGVILSTGNANEASGPNLSGSTSGIMSTSGDANLNSTISGTTQDAAVLQFDFVPASDLLEFQYVFGSEEYPEFAPPNSSTYNDVFAFFISGGPENYNNVNVALIPGTTTPVSINNVNAVTNTSYYRNNENNPNVQYDGLTVTLTATKPVTACSTYHIKLAIADVGDGSYDSAVFLKANSFASGEDYTVASFNSWSNSLSVMRGCSNFIVFSRAPGSPLNVPVPIELTIGGTATPGVDYSDIPTSLVIPAGETSITVYFDAFDTGVLQGDETIILTFENGCPCSLSATDHVITIVDVFDLDSEMENDGPICVGDDATLTISLNTPFPDDVSIEWHTGELDVDQLIVTPDVTTTYFADIIFPCDTITISTTVTVIELPVVDLGPDFDVAALTTNLTAGMAPGNTGEWTITGGPGNANVNPTNTSNTTVVVDIFGVYNFTWTETSLAPNCVASDDINVNFLHIPTADFVASSVNCFGDYTTITFTGDAIDGLSNFEWDFGPATVISGSGRGPYILDFPDSGTFNISLVVTESILTVDYDINIFVPPLLTGTISKVDDPCFESCNGSATLSIQGGVAPYSYSWGSSSNHVSNLCAGDYGVTVTDVRGCTFGTTYTINQPPVLEYDTIFSNVLCHGDYTGNAEIIATGGTPPYQALWSDGYNLMSHNGICAGIYQVTVLDSHGCSVFEQFNITQPNSLRVVTSGNFSICEHQHVNIASQPSGGILPYEIYWDNGDGSGFNSGAQTFQITPHEDVTYTVYVEDANGCISNFATSKVIVSPEIFIDLTTEDNTCYQSCDGKARVTVTGGLQPFSYSWASGGPYANNLCDGLYTLTITDQIGCNIDTMFIISEPLPLQMTLETQDALCSYSTNGTSQAMVTGGTPPYNYVWANANNTNNLIAPSGTYGLTVSDDHNCRIYGTANISSPQILRVLPLSNPTICIGGEAEVIAQVSGGMAPYNFYWHGTDGSEEFQHIFYASPESTTTYSLTVTDNNGCTAAGSSVQVKVRPPLSIDNIINSVNNVCLGYGTDIELDISGGNGGPYQITTNEGEIVGSHFTYYPEETINLVFTVEDMCETPSVSDSITINVYETPFVNFTIGANEGCQGHRIQFNSLDTVENCEYVWNFGDDVFAFVKNPSHVYSESGFFEVELTISDEFGCSNSIIKDSVIFIYPQPYANFSPEPEVASIFNPQIKFINYSEKALFNFWYYGDGDSTINFRSPIHTYDAIGEYEVILVSQNEYGCTDTAKRSVFVRTEHTIYAPTAFTPNGDGINDCFRLCGSGINKNTFFMKIYDRWGELVYSTEKYVPDADCSSCGEGSWDGTKGSHNAGDKYLPNGIYYWYAGYIDSEQIGHEHRGNIQLVR
ncbi:MAG: choice-of-anchor L domain-containing protein [Bacteroidales bacterium]|nr:choice-of-anchor L domain-containing protein [Bacteroidales bacterium]